jgi:hypothetical protein
MAEFKVVEDAGRAERSRGRKSWTFTVDGEPSLAWCPTKAAAERIVNRLRLGRSGEAFGGAGVASAGPQMATALSRGHDKPARAKVIQVGEVTTEEVVAKSGKVKPRQKRPAFSFELDGKHREEFKTTSEAEAKAACAVEAFMTRGKRRRLAEAEAAFKELHGLNCKVQTAPELSGKFVAKDEKGGIWAVKMGVEGAIKFDLVVPAAPGK